MNRNFISSWIKTALPTISTYSMTSFASGRTTTITIDRTEPSMGRPHTSGSWQKPLPVCHLPLETLHNVGGSPTRARTWDLRINSPSGHRPESHAGQRFQPKRRVIFSAGFASFPSVGLIRRRDITEPPRTNHKHQHAYLV